MLFCCFFANINFIFRNLRNKLSATWIMLISRYKLFIIFQAAAWHMSMLILPLCFCAPLLPAPCTRGVWLSLCLGNPGIRLYGRCSSRHLFAGSSIHQPLYHQGVQRCDCSPGPSSHLYCVYTNKSERQMDTYL